MLKTVAKSVLVNPEGKILVLQRSSTDLHSPGRVDFPGGGVDDGEDIIFAAVREIKEEVGLAVKASTLRLAYAQTSEPNHEGDIITRLLFVGAIATTNVVLSYEHDAYWWHSPREVVADFNDSSWTDGIRFVIDHRLI